MTFSFQLAGAELAECMDHWQKERFVGLRALRRLAQIRAQDHDPYAELLQLATAFNGSDISKAALQASAAEGDDDARQMLSLLTLAAGKAQPYRPCSAAEFNHFKALLKANPDALYDDPSLPGYPYYVPGKTYLYDIEWVRKTLSRSREQLGCLKESTQKDIAVLVGNGPSLNNTDLSLLIGHDIFITNYAIKSDQLSKLAKGVAVTNYLVAEQEPYQFFLDRDKWKIFPFWLRNTLVPDNKTIFLNAEGGDLFFSKDINRRICWNSTVTYFWLQILYFCGYKKVIMIGFDHSYAQKKSAKEGDLILQKDADTNHFDPNYFKGKRWQAADVSKMEETYIAAKAAYEQDGREIVNCTVGGLLEVFRRGNLSAELVGGHRSSGSLVSGHGEPRIVIVTPCWKGDVVAAEMQWRLTRRLGNHYLDHVHFFKHTADVLPPVTFKNVQIADIEGKYPEQANLPHPAGPNLLFAHTVRALKNSGYTHFFWFEPDCIPTAPEWLAPFIEAAAKYPDEPIIGAGGGTVTPGKDYWKHHFAGCSLYNIEALNRLDWDDFISNHLDISFDMWLTVSLKYIELLDINDEDTNETIIFGSHRYNWKLLRRPECIVQGMFEHWRPEKFLSKKQISDLIKSKSFSLFHSIKEEKIIRNIFKNSPESASVIVINYNNGKFLKEAIWSTLNQEDIESVRYEVIVVDDGSTDDSLDYIMDAGTNIKPILLEHGSLNGNYNQQRAFMHGLNHASGDVVFLLDGDDTFSPKKISRVLSEFRDPDVVLVQHALYRTNADGVDSGDDVAFFPDKQEISFDFYKTEKRTNFFQPTSGLAFRRSYLNTISDYLQFDQFHQTWLDVRLTRLAPAFGRIVSLTDRLGAWRRHAKSDSINLDNVAARLNEHHCWLNSVGKRFSLSIDYQGSRQHKDLTARSPIPYDGSGGYFVCDDGVYGGVAHLSEKGLVAADGFGRGRMATVVEGEWPNGDMLKFDLFCTRDDLDAFMSATTAPPAPENDEPYGYIFIVEGAADHDAAKTDALARSYRRSVRRVKITTQSYAERCPSTDTLYRIARAMGYGLPLAVSGHRTTIGPKQIVNPTFIRLMDDHAGSMIEHDPIAGTSNENGVMAEALRNPYEGRSPPSLDTVMSSPEIRRKERVSVDETGVIANLLSTRKDPLHIMLDVGAHFGTSAAFFNALGWTIYCFEPDPGNRAKLVAKFGKSDNITIDSRAVSDRPATGVPFFKSDESTGISGLHAFRDTHREDGRVDVTTVEEIVRDRGIGHVDFLKIDVEGFDFSVLKGVPWDRLKPDVIECEFEDYKTVPLGHTYKDVARYLHDKGYAVYLSEWHPIVRYGTRHDWRRIVRYPGPDLPSDAWGNILAFRQDPGFAAVAAAFEAVIARSRPGFRLDLDPASASVSDSRAASAGGNIDTGGRGAINGPTTRSAGAAAASPAARQPQTRSFPAVLPSTPLYTRVADWASARNPILYRLGQFVMWCLRAARLQKPATAAFVLALAGLVAGGLFGPGMWSTVSWVAAGVLTGLALLVATLGFAGHLIRRGEDEMRVRLASQDRLLRTLESKRAAAEKVLGEQLAKAARTEALSEQLGVLERDLSGRLDAFAEATNQRLNQMPEFDQIKLELLERVQSVETDLQRRIAKIPEETDRRVKGVEALTNSAGVFNIARFQRFSRTLKDADIETLIRDWSKPLGLELTRARLGYIAHRACLLESQMKGRFATSIEALVLRCLVASSLKREEASLLEIGTLFGVGAAAVYEVAANDIESVHLTVIDPLDGYYAEGNRDILTGAQISEQTLLQNWSIAPIPEEDFTIIKHLSEAPEAIQAAGQRRYDMLIIDGDHSYDGVKFDFETYSGLVRAGGYILFDDYDVEDWPDIKRYVDDEIAKLPNLYHVGSAFRTAVYQVRRSAARKGARPRPAPKARRS